MLMSKSDFATAIKRSPGRVSQLIKEGKIHGRAIEGDKINVEIAREQLGLSLDPSQQLAQSSPILSEASVKAPAPTSSAGSTLMAERAEGVRLENEMRRRKLAADIGKYTLTEEARAAQGREMGELIQLIDTWMAEAGKAIALEHNLDPRAVALALRNSWLAARARAAQVKRAQAEGMQELIDEAPSMLAAE